MPHHLPHIKQVGCHGYDDDGDCDFGNDDDGDESFPQEYGDRPPHLIHPHDDKDGGSPKKKEPHIKKPLNAFMLYMKVRIKKLNSHFSFYEQHRPT